jgi:hypothetical protein
MEMKRLTLDEVLGTLEDRPDTTQTYRVPSGTISKLPSDETPEMRSLADREVTELAAYLEVSATELRGPFKVVDIKCPSCSRLITFLDFARTAVEFGAHGKEELRSVLTGKNGEWITVRGRDGGRPVHCAQCGNAIPRKDVPYSEYQSRDYAYA